MAITSPSTPIFSSFFCCKRAYGPCLLFLVMNASMLRNFVIDSARWGLSIIVQVLAKFERQRVCVCFYFAFSCFTFGGFSGKTAMAKYICVLNKVPTDSSSPPLLYE
ncbi:hypothetical protein POPTR_001G127650v4 [Populus trichocarpa]|uniref:Uncharacterized protein n=1 Tax=Populus trichocarpa TaxID=3694 RepID=A0ACC0TJF1_POPTR|nr:hypothetical protein POPTR_001G127650v4 [Populus trichocarpa]